MSFTYGQPVPLAIALTNAAGAPANATAVVLTVTAPDLTVSLPSVTNPSAGSYTALYVPTQVGRHLVAWVATGTNASAYTDEFNVDPAAPPLLISLADAKQQLRIGSSVDDDQLWDFIAAATEIVEDLCGPMVRRQIVGEYVDLIGRTVWNELTTAGTRQIVLRNRPIISIDSISSAISSGVTYDPSVFSIESDTGIVRRLDNGTVFGPLRVTYTVGRTYVPRAVDLATRFIVQHLWETTRGKMGPPGVGGQEAAPTTGRGYALPNRALELLQPFLTVPAVG